MKISHGIALALAILAGSLATPAEAKKDNAKVGEWYVKTVIDVIDPIDGAHWHDRKSGVFGQLDASADGFDRHDIPAFASTVNSRAAITFIQGETWGEKAGEYVTDYRASGKNNDAWAFTVFSRIEGAEVTISWDGLFELEAWDDGYITRYRENRNPENPLLQKLSLVDLATYEVIEALDMAGGLNSYTFSLQPGETDRQFMWVLGPIKANYFEQGGQAKQYVNKAQKELKDNPGKGNPFAPPEDDPFEGP